MVLIGGGTRDAGAYGGDARSGMDEDKGVAGVDRKFGNHGGGERDLLVGRLGVDTDGGGFHLNAFANVAEGELGVDFGDLGSLKIYRGNLVLFEALYLDLEAVGTGCELRKIVEAALVG